MPAERPPLSLVDVAVGHGGRPLVEGVTFEVAPGEVRAIIGGSGCGKTTLLKAIIGLSPPLAGEVRLFGRPLAGLGGERRRQALGQLGVLFQNGALLGNLTALENVALPLAAAGDASLAACRELALMLLRRVGLPDAAGRLPRELSGGMQKRVGLARAMACRPRLLVCDEPSAGLDPVTAAGLDRLLVDLCREGGTSVVVVTHELASIDAIVDEATFLGAGRVLAQGPPAALRTHPQAEVRAFFAREGARPTEGARTLADVLCGEEARGG